MLHDLDSQIDDQNLESIIPVPPIVVSLTFSEVSFICPFISPPPWLVIHAECTLGHHGPPATFTCMKWINWLQDDCMTLDTFCNMRIW